MFLFMLLGCPSPLPPSGALTETVGDVHETAAVWGGFVQVWGYNHRINSLGDYVAPAACVDGVCTTDVVHTAASGSGSDEAAWMSTHTMVRGDGVRFLGGTTEIFVDREGSEGSWVTEAVDVVVPSVEGFVTAEAGQAPVYALLNGFDMVSTRDADRVEHLTVSVGSPTWEEDGLHLPVDLGMLFDCDSVECDGFLQTDTSVHYRVLVSWLLVTGDEADVVVSPAAAETAFTWDNRHLADELDLYALAEEGTVDGEPGFATAALGITALSLDMDRDHHMAEWATSVAPGTYDPEAGTLRYRANLGFKQWNAGTWWNPVSYTEPGSAAMRADVALIQVRDGCVQAGGASGLIHWTADGRPATEAAVDSRQVALECG